MSCTVPDEQTLQGFIQTIEATPPRPHHGALLAAMTNMLPECDFRYVLGKSGWHRAGGVLDADGHHLADDLESWALAEWEQCDHDFEQLIDRYVDKGLLATRHTGRSHYFVAAYGPAPEDFLQLEVEELQEVMDRKLFDAEQLPGDYQDLVEPIKHDKIEAHAVGSPQYRFVRLVDMRDVLVKLNAQCNGMSSLARFMSDWSQSRTPNCDHFSEHWVITGLEQYAPDKNSPFTASVISVHSRTLKPFQWDDSQSGTELSNQIRDFDRAAGYQGAWYFHVVGSKLVPDTLTDALQRDLDSGYEYLPEKELQLLIQLRANPYRADTSTCAA